MLIHAQPNGKLTEADRLLMGTLFLKAGYTVKIEKQMIEGKVIVVLEVT
jgi:hypothetical protein